MSRTKLRVAAAAATAGVVVAGLVTYAQAQTTDAPAKLPRVTVTKDGFAAGGAKFTPRGNNYVRLTDDGLGEGKKYHSNFEPGSYDADRSEAALAAMSRDGYNTVRVFIDPGDSLANKAGRPHGLGHGDDDDSVGQSAYFDNVADFVTKAAGGMRDAQIETCKLGLDGWLFWTWDTDEDDVQLLFFRATESDGVITGRLAPVARPDPCT